MRGPSLVELTGHDNGVADIMATMYIYAHMYSKYIICCTAGTAVCIHICTYSTADGMYVCMYERPPLTYSIVWVNRIRLPNLLMVS